MKLTIIIPSFNEGISLVNVVEKVLSVPISYRKEIIVVDDGSTDNTPKIFKKFAKNKDIKLIRNNKNLGKGASIILGLGQATGDLLLIQDADLEYNPDDIPTLLEPFNDDEVCVVYGSRVLGKNPLSHWTFYLGGRFVTLITNLLYGIRITDEPTGYKVFRKEILSSLNLKSKGFEFCPEVTAKIAKNDIKIYEVPISYNPRPVSEKKIKWNDGLAAIYYLIKYRFTD